jgi:hypothetical protein
MNVFEMIIGIILIATIGKVLQAYVRGGRDAAPDSAPDNADAVRLREEIRALKERIAVLERVITDSHSSVELEREIERLRDDNRV